MVLHDIPEILNIHATIVPRCPPHRSRYPSDDVTTKRKPPWWAANIKKREEVFEII